MAKPVGDLPPLPPAPEPPVPEPPAEPVPGPAAESVVEPNQVFFVFFSICGALVLFCLVFVFVGFVIWGGFFRAMCPFGHAPLSPFPFLVSFVFLGCYFL